MNPFQDLEFISGPVSWYYFEFMGRKFHFFGDRHFSKSGNCTDLFGIKCKSIALSGREVSKRAREKCYDIA